jgi:outer membrane receptor for ferrienterochelin and colicin
LFSQGIVRGKVTDDLGETVIGATLVFKENPSKGAVTDFDGNYSLEVNSDQPQIIVVSFIGFQSQEASVNPKGGEVVIRDFDLKPENFEMDEIVIEAKANRAGDFYMEKVKKNAATSIDYISSETIRKIGDSNVSSAVRRVTGVSTVGSFVTVRGLADRYILTTINGNRIPTLDPFTNNLRLDIFPTGLVDNLVITKTGDPELPGDWSGAYISVETKDYPDKFTLSVQSSFGYNNQSTGRDIIAQEGSDTDWLGFDNGFRDIPEGVPTVQGQFPRITTPTLYQQFAYLGIEDYMNSLGITQNSLILQESAFHQLGLIELDYLGAAQFGNEAALNNAIESYELENPDFEFFRAFNGDLERIGTSFNNTWFAVTKRAPINFSQNISIGDQTKLFGKTLGIIGGFRYSSDYRYDPESELNRTTRPPNFPAENGEDIPTVVSFDQELSRETHGMSGLLKLSYKLNGNNSVSLLFMPNLLGQSNVRRYVGQDANSPGGQIVYGDDQFYEERQQLIYQYASEHYFPGSAMKLKVDASYSDGDRNVLDFKDTQYIQEGDQFLFRSTFNPDRRYRYMEDNMLDTRVSLEIPLSEDKRQTKLFVGGGYHDNERQNQQVIYTLQGVEDVPQDNPPVDEITNDRFFIPDSAARFDLWYTAGGTELDSDIGFRKIYSVFAKVDHQLNERIRLVGGVRAEYTDIFQDILEYYERGLPIDSPDRDLQGGQRVNPSSIEEWDILPSINVIYKINPSEAEPFNLRASYFGSIARPSFREISNMSLLDFELRGRVEGNPDLVITDVQNFDLRLEKYFSNGSTISGTVFYKTFKDHIELILQPGEVFSWQNVPESRTVGIEIEGKHDLTEKLELRGNFSWIWSETIVTEPVREVRPMFGQAPYIINAMLTYDFERIGLFATVSYNIQGPKLAVVAGAGEAAPNIFEVPRNIVDINLRKNLGKHFGIGLKVRDLVNNPLRRAYDFDAGYILDFNRVRWGTTYQLNISYTI